MTDGEPHVLDHDALVDAVEELLVDIGEAVPTPEQWARLKSLMEMIY